MFSVAENYFLFFFVCCCFFEKLAISLTYQSIKNNKVMTTTTKKTSQQNIYVMLDSCGRKIEHILEDGTQCIYWIVASNVKEASHKARELYGSKVWKVQRCYNGGVRG